MRPQSSRRRSLGASLTLALVVALTTLLSGQVGRFGQDPGPSDEPGRPRTRIVKTARLATGSQRVQAPRVLAGAPRGRSLELSAVSASRFVPGEVIVKFDPTRSDLFSSRLTESRLTASLIAALQDTVAVRDVEVAASGDFVVLTLEPGADPEAAAQALERRPDVRYAQPNYLRPALFVPNDPFYHLQWNLTQIGLERAWEVNRGAQPTVTVAVIDSGVAFESTTIEFVADEFRLDGRVYPALGQVTVPFEAADDLSDPSRFVAPFDFVWGDEHPVDMSGHGTHVTGTVGQLTDNRLGVAGVAFNVRIMPLKVLADEWDYIFGAVPACCGAADADVALAVRHAVDSGADVINMSLGGPEPSPVIDEAVRFAVGQDVFVSIAGGNSFDAGNPTIWPAAAAAEIDGAVSVAAVDRQMRRAWYSNTGSYIEIAAPGGDQRQDGYDGVVQQTLDPDFAWTFLRPPSQFGPPRFDVMAFIFFQGTSMAAPHVAGLAAMLKAQGVSSPAAIEAALKLTATDLGAPGSDEEFGAGLVDAAALVRGLGLAR